VPPPALPPSSDRAADVIVGFGRAFSGQLAEDTFLRYPGLMSGSCNTLAIGGAAMRSRFTLEYWRDGDFYVGRLLEVPAVFSQGETLEELRENIQDAYDLMVTQERTPAPATAQQQPVELDV